MSRSGGSACGLAARACQTAVPHNNLAFLNIKGRTQEILAAERESRNNLNLTKMALTVSHDLQALHDYSKRAMIDLISCHSKEGTWDISGDSVAPPPYSEEERSRIPDPEIFAKTETRRLSADSNGSLAFCQLPSVSQCATHLELLQAFYALRAQVLGSTELDKLFDIKPESPMATRKLKEIGLQDRYLGEKKRSKWPLFVDFAVVRFQIWAKRVDPMLVDPYEKKKGGGKGNNDADVLLAPLGT